MVDGASLPGRGPRRGVPVPAGRFAPVAWTPGEATAAGAAGAAARPAEDAAGPLRRLAVAANIVQVATALLLAPPLTVAVTTATRPELPVSTRVLEGMAGFLAAAALARGAGLSGVWPWRLLAGLVLAVAPVFVVLSATVTLATTDTHLPPPLADGAAIGRVLLTLAAGGVLAAGVIALLGRRADRA